MKKIGFLHIPRTGGTYLESILSHLGPDKYVNFFGTPDNQVENKVGIIENIGSDDGLREREIKNNPNFQTAEIFSGHFSASILEFLPEYDIELITILRDPITRSASFVKKVCTQGRFENYLMQGAQKRGDDKFWDNLITYMESGTYEVLAPHEQHGISNYMTKAIGGAHLYDPDLVVDDALLDRAKENLSKMRYVGSYETYKDTVDYVLSMFGLEDFIYTVRDPRDHGLSDKIVDFLKSINDKDLELYRYYKEEIKNEQGIDLRNSVA